MVQGRSTKIVSMIKWIRTSKLSIMKSLSPLRPALRSALSLSLFITLSHSLSYCVPHTHTQTHTHLCMHIAPSGGSQSVSLHALCYTHSLTLAIAVKGVAPLQALRPCAMGFWRSALTHNSASLSLTHDQAQREVGHRAGARQRREFKLPWREAGSPNHLNDEVDSDQSVVNKELSQWVMGQRCTRGRRKVHSPVQSALVEYARHSLSLSLRRRIGQGRKRGGAGRREEGTIGKRRVLSRQIALG